MRYVSLDLETTGGNPDRHQIIELAAVVEDTRHVLPLAELPAGVYLVQAGAAVSRLVVE